VRFVRFVQFIRAIHAICPCDLSDSSVRFVQFARAIRAIFCSCTKKMRAGSRRARVRSRRGGGASNAERGGGSEEVGGAEQACGVGIERRQGAVAGQAVHPKHQPATLPRRRGGGDRRRRGRRRRGGAPRVAAGAGSSDSSDSSVRFVRFAELRRRHVVHAARRQQIALAVGLVIIGRSARIQAGGDAERGGGGMRRSARLQARRAAAGHPPGAGSGALRRPRVTPSRITAGWELFPRGLPPRHGPAPRLLATGPGCAYY
jgi:hypothetical protein